MVRAQNTLQQRDKYTLSQLSRAHTQYEFHKDETFLRADLHAIA